MQGRYNQRQGYGLHRRRLPRPGIMLACASLATLMLLPAARSQPAATTQPSLTPAGKAVNPHFTRTGCRECHRIEDGHAQKISLEQIEGICLKCHDGRKAPQEPHPIGIPFTSAQVVRPEGWPTPGGKLSCITCHDVRRAGHGERAPADNPFFLRGPQPQSTLAFCGTCHAATPQQQRFNPHIMVDAEGHIQERACLFCHTKEMPRDAMVRTGSPALRREPLVLCVSCHGQHVDWFEPGHIGHKVSPERKAYMAVAQSGPQGRPVTREQVKEALRAGLSPKRLPLGNGNTIVCSTCHNPHERGVFPQGSVLAEGAGTWGEDGEHLALRGSGKEICSGCHNK